MLALEVTKSSIIKPMSQEGKQIRALDEGALTFYKLY